MICGDLVINQWPKNSLEYVLTFEDSYRARCSDKNVRSICHTVVPPRLSIDHSPVNGHGSTILEFLIDYDIYMLNVSTKGADYVSVSTKHSHLTI